MAWTGSPKYGEKDIHVDAALKRLPTSKLEEFSDTGLSLSDLKTALDAMFDTGYAAGNLDTTEDFQRAAKQPREGVLFVGDTVGLTHGASRLVGTVMEGGVISTPGMSGTIEEFAGYGWRLDYFAAPQSEDDDD
ncbi:hypothetical protein PBI_DEWDROP_104 [Microbacterium phage Dewdrop]|nr:hypothetical protein PBI_LEAF_104 [Microbacterium phage Leaf]QGZ17472.1 hypothetical protein PBI_DEWDROP_104 [Microbacterium phage Dewdrop]